MKLDPNSQSPEAKTPLHALATVSEDLRQLRPTATDVDHRASTIAAQVGQ